MHAEQSAGSESDELAPDAMTIHQLAQRSGVPARRIRHYVAERLLPPPVGRGRAAHYGKTHLALLAQIQALREVNLSLDEIRQRLGAAPTLEVPGSAPATTWRRWEIAPGIELHARADLEREAASMVRVLAGVAREMLAERVAGSHERE